MKLYIWTMALSFPWQRWRNYMCDVAMLTCLMLIPNTAIEGVFSNSLTLLEHQAGQSLLFIKKSAHFLFPSYILPFILPSPHYCALGIGKSCCGALHLCKCLVQSKTVILEIAGDRSTFYKLKLGGKPDSITCSPCLIPLRAHIAWFHRDVGLASSSLLCTLHNAESVLTSQIEHAFSEELLDEEVCYFIDSGLPSNMNMQAEGMNAWLELYTYNSLICRWILL